MRQQRLPWIPIIILGTIIFCAAAAPLITPYSPIKVDLLNRLVPPVWMEGGSPAHIIGTDSLGRDLLTRIFYGARISLMVAVFVLSVGGPLGLALGIIAGYKQGPLSAVIMRLVDGVLAVPGLLLALIFSMTLGSSMATVVIALSFHGWCRFARITRGEVLTLMTRDFVLQARIAGCSPLRIMLVHLVPNVLNAFMIMASLQIGQIILSEATLSFLGAGIPPPTPSWGQIVSEGRGYMTSAWWIAFFPGLALSFTVFAMNLAGDWVRDRLDPKLRQL
ncbi:ABC transporter permease [Chloroflexota bacterium]